MIYIVSVSGGLGSAEALRRAIVTYGKENIDAVFMDVAGNPLISHDWSNMPAIDALLHERYGGEHRDTKRFLWQLSHALDVPIRRIQDPRQRTIWSVFVETKSLRLVVGKAFYCKASDELKRKVFVDYCRQRYKTGEYSIVAGMNWDEQHRVKRMQVYYQKALGWDVPIIAPLAEKPWYVHNGEIAKIFEGLGCDISSAYKEINLEHDNCSGICVQAGQAHYALMYLHRFEHYMYAAWMERRIQQAIGHDYTILKDERGGKTKRMSLYDFMPRIKAGDYPKTALGGCGCMTNMPMNFVKSCGVKVV